MSEIRVQSSEILDLIKKFETALQEMPDIRRKTHEKIGERILQELRAEIGGSGKVASWQDKFTGTSGGYVAVRARNDVSHKGYAVSYITNAIEQGHKIRHSALKVRGRYFYRNTKQKANSIAVQEAEAFLDELASKLG